MSKLSLGALACLTLAAAAAVPVLAGAGSSDTVLNTGAPAPQVTSAPAASLAAAGEVRVAAATTTKTTTRTTTPAKLVLPVPAPTKLSPQPDPNSAVCRTTPTAPFCTVDSVRYFVMATPVKAQERWLPVLTKWGLANVQNSCVDQPAQADQLCVVRGTHNTQKVTVLFKAVFEGQYAPANVKKQSDAIRKTALANVARAKTVAQKAKLLQDATTKIAALEKAADAWNAAHPKTSVNVNVDA